jgi:hypothetical protein
MDRLTASMPCFSRKSLSLVARSATAAPASVNLWARKSRLVTLFTSEVVPRYRRKVWNASGVKFESTVPRKVDCAFDTSFPDAVDMQNLSYSIKVEKMNSASLWKKTDTLAKPGIRIPLQTLNVSSLTLLLSPQQLRPRKNQ